MVNLLQKLIQNLRNHVSGEAAAAKTEDVKCLKNSVGYMKLPILVMTSSMRSKLYYSSKKSINV